MCCVYCVLLGSFTVFGHMATVAKTISEGKTKRLNFQLLEGFSAETSGGLLICLPKEAAGAFCKEIEVEFEL